MQGLIVEWWDHSPDVSVDIDIGNMIQMEDVGAGIRNVNVFDLILFLRMGTKILSVIASIPMRITRQEVIIVARKGVCAGGLFRRSRVRVDNYLERIKQ